MFRRIKNLIRLSEAPKEAIDDAVKAMKEIAELLGDGKAVFLGEGTSEEFKEQENSDKGIKGIFGL